MAMSLDNQNNQHKSFIEKRYKENPSLKNIYNQQIALADERRNLGDQYVKTVIAS